MNRDRSEYNGGSPSSDGDDHEVDLTGEFEIVYTPPAWYAQSTGTAGGAAQETPSPPPPTGPPVSPQPRAGHTSRPATPPASRAALFS